MKYESKDDIVKKNDFGMIVYERRLQTFKKWPFHAKDGAACTADKMAEAGFFCIRPYKEPDAVRCFVCKKELDGWEPEDVPEEEHKKHSPNCEFLKIGCKMETEATVEQFLSVFCRSQIINNLDAEKEAALKVFDEQTAEEFAVLEAEVPARN